MKYIIKQVSQGNNFAWYWSGTTTAPFYSIWNNRKTEARILDINEAHMVQQRLSALVNYKDYTTVVEEVQ